MCGIQFNSNIFDHIINIKRGDKCIVQCEICGKWVKDKGLGSHKWRVHGEGQSFKPTLGKQPWSKGLTKETSELVKSISDKIRKNVRYRDEVDDDGKLYSHYQNKKTNAKKENLEVRMSFEEYCELVHEAGLKSSQLGFKGDGYVLARYNDRGDYTKDNCRFITQIQNAH